MIRWKRWAVPLVSLVIVIVLAFQAAATFRLLCPPARINLPQIVCEPATWPFVNYNMYSQPYYAGDLLNQYVLYGIVPDETEIIILPHDLGLTIFQFEDFINALLNQDIQQARIYAKEYETQQRKSLRGMRLENHPVALLESGWREDAARVVMTIDFGGGQ